MKVIAARPSLANHSTSAPDISGNNPHGGGRYIPVLDGWRAIAIILVLLFHGSYNTDVSGSRSLTALATVFGRAGALGVLIFFCISGYLITKRLYAESGTRGRFSLHHFYIKRFFRIIPPLVAYLLVICGLGAAGFVSLHVMDWSAIVFMTNYLPGSWYTAHFWSLSVEEHFYLFWPACVLLLGWRRAMWVGWGLIIAVGLWRPWELHHVAAKAQVLQHTDMRLDYIMMGCVAALAVEYYPPATKILTRVGSGPGLLALLLALIVSTRTWPVDMRSVQAAILTLLICASSTANARVSLLLLANPFMLFVGRISYSLYIWQQLFLAPSHNPFLRSAAALPLRYAAALLTAYLSYRFLERPFIQYGRKLIANGSSLR